MKYLKTINEFNSNDKLISNEDSKIKDIKKKREIYEKDLIKSGHIDKEEDLIDNFNRILKILKRDCSLFINELKSSKSSLLFRGIRKLKEGPVVENDESIDGLYVKTPRKNRMPLDTDPGIVEIFDDYFEQNFGDRIRSKGVFATKDPLTARSYSSWSTEFKKSKAYIFFPIDNYEYYWSPYVIDLFSKIENERWYFTFGQDDGDFAYEYDDIYGDPRVNTWSQSEGYFRLFGKDLSLIKNNNIPSYIRDNHKQFGLEYKNGAYLKDDKIVISDDSMLHNISELEWIPDLEFEDWLKEHKPDRPEEKISEIVDGYVKGQLKNNIDQELTFILDSYYIIDEKYYFLFKQWLESII